MNDRRKITLYLVALVVLGGALIWGISNCGC